uniref:Multiple epidermal growth factor-like domains protein 6 n=1 Tax=Romanomermis culicivorax TaxID=13658 RepID=A0A915JQ96_ROMCU
MLRISFLPWILLCCHFNGVQSKVDLELQELRLGEKNVCPHEDVEIVTVQEPCIQAYTRYVRKWKPNCENERRWCVVKEPKTVYYRSFKATKRQKRQTTLKCCHGWMHVPGTSGCSKVNCTSDLCYNGGTCEGSNYTAKLCQCPEGFQGSRCQYDINECLVANGGCHHDCCNTIGTFYCRCWPGFQLANDQKSCEDVDECKVENGGCEYRCVNANGGFRCECPANKQLHPDGRRCIDENSCEFKNGGCSQICEEENDKFLRCRCSSGYKLASDKRTCYAIDPCQETKGLCQHHCVNDNGRARCQCYPGYRLSHDMKTCIDMDECSLSDKGQCEHTCVNTYGSYVCRCKSGYQLASDQKACIKIGNDCKISNGGCSQICQDIFDDVKCSCKQGFRLASNGKDCEIFDDCRSKGCEHSCVHSPGQPSSCTCKTGYSLAFDDRSCNDINECLQSNGGCSHYCRNEMGSFSCACRPGYIINTDNKTCDALIVLETQFSGANLSHYRYPNTDHKNSNLMSIAEYYYDKPMQVWSNVKDYNVETKFEMRRSMCETGKFGPLCEYSCGDCRNDGKCN